ncbi:MAG: hypothetical protein K6G88_12905 [Lachnospiraceae bacterium]|nr:hypothetical protein [Lachnospiraceae bacterium]
MKGNTKQLISLFLNIVIVILTFVGIYLTFFVRTKDGYFLTKGISNFKYFTVLSNVFCGAVALIYLIELITRRADKSKATGKYLCVIRILKVMAVTAVGLTFVQIIAFLGPLYGYAKMYKGANLYFHLIIPILAMVDYIVTDLGDIPFRDTIWGIVPTLLYGVIYYINIIINGIGEWPNGNDWYGFMNWGMPGAIAIMAGSLFVSFLIGCILRKLNSICATRRSP